MEPSRVTALKRAQTAVAHISSIVIPSVLQAAENGEIEKAPPHPLSLDKPGEAHIYKLEPAQRLPIANLRLTLSWYMLNSANNLAFLKWTKQWFRVLTWMNRVGLILGLVALVAPRQFAPFLVPPACLLTIPASSCSYAMLSTDLVWILVRQYEFWFFTIVNVTTWAVLGSLCRDARIVFLVIAFFDIELMVLMDANFRTFVPAVRTCAGAVPVLAALSVIVLLGQLDLPPHRAHPIQLGKLILDEAEIFTNAILTLLLFLLRKVYNKRKLLYKRNASSRVVRCMILRCVLLLRPQTAHIAFDEKAPRRQYGTSVVLKKLGITTHGVHPGSKAGRALNCRQQLTLVSLRLSTIDVCKTLYPRWWSVQHAIRLHDLAAFYSIGVLGLLLSGGSMLIPGSEGETTFISLSETWIIGIPLLGFACTLAFCAVFACAYQRDFVRAMFRNFGFLFPSVQFALGCVCLADAMRWDNRCWAIASYCLWFHWILLLDALTPATRKQLRFRKQFAVPVVIAVWIGMLSVLYAIIIDSPMLNDRKLLQLRLGLKVITTGTKSILLNRILTILVWTMRLMWQILRASENELVLLRGTLDYYCPFDTFSATARQGSLKSVVPVAARRESGSMVLSPSTDSSNESMQSSLQRILRRTSYLLPIPLQPQLRPSIISVTPLPPEGLPDAKSRSHDQAVVTAILTTDALSSTANGMSRQEVFRPEVPNEET